jgi:hypothetical protein
MDRIDGLDPGDPSEQVGGEVGDAAAVLRLRVAGGAAFLRIALSVSYSDRRTFGRSLTTRPQTTWRPARVVSVDFRSLTRNPSSRAIAAIFCRSRPAGRDRRR